MIGNIRFKVTKSAQPFLRWCMLASFPRTSAYHAHSLTADNNSEVVVKARASLLKTLTRFDRCSKMYLARIETDSMWTLNSGDRDELGKRPRKIPGAPQH